jgi:hypothetical protein
MEIRQNLRRAPTLPILLVVGLLFVVVLGLLAWAVLASPTPAIAPSSAVPAVTSAGLAPPDVRDRTDPYSARDPLGAPAAAQTKSDPYSPRDPLPGRAAGAAGDPYSPRDPVVGR